MANFLDCIFCHCGPTTVRPPARLAFTPDWPYRFVNGQTVTVHRLRIGGAFVDARPVHAGGFSFGRRPTLCSETLRIPDRLRTAVTVRLSLSAISVMVFPASAI